LLEAFESWTRLLDEGHEVDVIFLDYRKAFDTVPHRRLIAKLARLGIPERMQQWVKNFLTGRHMRVMISTSFSDWATVKSGVPQGSVLRPLIFLIFVNELPHWVVNSMRMFADDTKIWAAINSIDDSSSLQKDLDKLVEWSEEWLLSFNIEKCKVMHIGHSLPTPYTMSSSTGRNLLEVTRKEKDLGTIVTSDLKPSQQCSVSANKAMSILGLINRTFKRIDEEDFKLLYNCYVRPHLEYCIQVWSPYLVKDILHLESVQKRATKLVTSIKKLSYTERLRKLNIYSLERRRLRGDLIEMYKILTAKEKVD